MIRISATYLLLVMGITVSCKGYDFGPEDIIVDKLLHDEIVSISLLRNELDRIGKIVTCKNDLLCIGLKCGMKGVFKPFSEHAIFAEVAAYKASHTMGFSLVPPTVVRTIQGKVGSLQLFVNTNVDTRVKGVFEHAIDHADPDELANLKIFYYVFGQWCFRKRNILINAENGHFQFIAIDNEALWHRHYCRYGDDPFVDRHWKGLKIPTLNYESFPYDHYYTMKNPTPASIRKEFGVQIPQRYIKSFCAKNSLNYAYYKDSLWVQFQGDAPCFAYTSHFPEDTIAKLKQIDRAMLHEIFSDAKGADFVTDEFLDSILDRRDQVLAHYEMQKKSS